MEFNLKTTKIDTIYNYLIPILKQILLEYSFLNLKEEEFKNIVLEEIKRSKGEYNEQIDYSHYIKSKTKNKLDLIVLEQLNNEDNLIKLISNYIDNNFKNTNNYQKLLLYLEKLQLFFDKYKIIFTPDKATQLISNNLVINKILKQVVELNINTIEDNQIDTLFNSANIIALIEAYCQLNNIIIKDYANSDITSLSITKNIYDENSLTQYFKTIANQKVLTKEEEQQLFFKIRQGNTYAKQIMIEANLKLVVSIAKKYVYKGLDIMDLIQEGNLGLIMAVDRYDYTQGYKFSTYATYWIRHTILSALAKDSRIINLPINLHNQIVKYRKIQTQLSQKNGEKTSIEEIAKIMNISIKQAKKIEKYEKAPLSLNVKVGEFKQEEFGDFVEITLDQTEEKVFLDQLQFQIKDLLKSCGLTEREIMILTLRNTEINGKILTLSQISKDLGLSRERVRQIESKALKKIRNSYKVDKLASFMENPEKSMENIFTYRNWYQDNPISFRSFLSENESDETPKNGRVKQKK